MRSLGRHLVDALTAFVVVAVIGLGLLPTPTSANPPPGGPPLSIETLDIRLLPGNPNYLQAAGEFYGAPYHRYKLTLAADPTGNGTYTVVVTDTITAGADGYTSWGFADLSGIPPYAAQGWNVRVAINGLDDNSFWLLNPPAWVAAP